ncbi:MAG: putative toxin-antitoxin system toxin component, PIN family [bacterium]|nr:putative toxin-antitoxin system toxin component, PIN family [bacterium]
MKVVIDTNVIISSLLSSSGPPAKIISLWEQQKIEVVASTEIIREYEEVLIRLHSAYDKITKNEINKFIKGVRQFSIITKPQKHFNVVLKDKDDNVFIDCAVSESVQFIISGDKHLLSIGEFQHILILTPTKFLQKYSF